VERKGVGRQGVVVKGNWKEINRFVKDIGTTVEQRKQKDMTAGVGTGLEN
jgi:hypothetical protein